MYKVSFANADLKANFRNKNKLRRFLAEIFKLESKSLYLIQYVFCSDDYLIQINRSFLGHDNYTDIITFDLSEGSETTGEIYISTERVVENAQSLQTGFQHELQRVIFHGALHLCGYKDKTKSEIIAMRDKEDYYLRLFDLWTEKANTHI